MLTGPSPVCGHAVAGSREPSRNSRSPPTCRRFDSRSVSGACGAGTSFGAATHSKASICFCHFLMPVGSTLNSSAGPCCCLAAANLSGRSLMFSPGASTTSKANLPVAYQTAKPQLCAKPLCSNACASSASGAPSTWPRLSRKLRTAVVSTERSCRGTRFPPKTCKATGSYACVREFHGLSRGSSSSTPRPTRRYKRRPAAE
mmetsp:Transcript_142593/g.397294  ORF Transcript_142593/g.397294 Transcript_142593/m.397294 type:complete len:202 (+) Transcript_142593:180-785(+)